jgi:hypothetical protein
MTEIRTPFFPQTRSRASAIDAGFRFGHVGTHSSRTMMFDELVATLAAVPVSATAGDYSAAIIEDNCLGKQTVANRRHSLQHLRELYALDPTVPLFRVLSRLWAIDTQGRPLLALLTSLARDPLLLGTAAVIVGLPDGAEFQRTIMRTSIANAVGERLNDSTLEKVIRNIASSWAQSGHLQGRTFKIRRLVQATPAAVAFALYLASAAGFHGQEILTSAWVRVLDCGTSTALELTLEAKRIGLVDLRVAGDAFDLNLDRLDPRRSMEVAHGKN